MSDLNNEKKEIGPLSKQIDETVARLQAQGFIIKAIFDCHITEDAKDDDMDVCAKLVNLMDEGEDYLAEIPKKNFPQNKWTRFTEGTIFFMFLGNVSNQNAGKNVADYGIEDLQIVPIEYEGDGESFVFTEFSTAVWTQEMIDEVNRKAEEMYAFFQQGKARMRLDDEIEESQAQTRPEIQTQKSRVVHVTKHEDKDENDNEKE